MTSTNSKITWHYGHYLLIHRLNEIPMYKTIWAHFQKLHVLFTFCHTLYISGGLLNCKHIHIRLIVWYSCIIIKKWFIMQLCSYHIYLLIHKKLQCQRSEKFATPHMINNSYFPGEPEIFWPPCDPKRKCAPKTQNVTKLCFRNIEKFAQKVSPTLQEKCNFFSLSLGNYLKFCLQGSYDYLLSPQTININNEARLIKHFIFDVQIGADQVFNSWIDIDWSTGAWCGKTMTARPLKRPKQTSSGHGFVKSGVCRWSLDVWFYLGGRDFRGGEGYETSDRHLELSRIHIKRTWI